MTAFDLVIFDCDGTLVDSEYLNNMATCEMLQEAGFSQYTLEYAYAHFVGLNQKKIFEKIERENNTTMPRDMRTRFIDKVRAGMKEHLRAAPGMPELAHMLAKTHKICVASNGERENVEGALIATGIMAALAPGMVFTAADVPNPKPAPDLFLYAARQNGVAPERCVVIEDSGPGVMAGVAAGMTVFGYAGLAHDPEKQTALLQEKGAHRILNHLNDILVHA